jgi:exodeoxyribonuclease VII large subunit
VAHVFSVAELTLEIQAMLGGAFPSIAVRGQISNLRRQSSGHVYFSLKDEQAQLVCAMWRSSARRLRFRPEDGQEVVAAGRIDVYPPHGKYQLIVDDLAPLGVGELHVRLEELKRKLALEGLFSEDRKQLLPLLPRRVAVITSPTSAALRDFLRIASRRAPGAWITVFPVRVQGDEAPGEIVRAFDELAAVGEFDVVVATRGGGSIEDLWAFNEEAVARAIAACPVPVVSAVGHETDTTLADLVADARAATPSEAAEIVFPETAELSARLAEGRARLERAAGDRLVRARERVVALEKSHALARPVERLGLFAQRLDEWEERAGEALDRALAAARERLARTAAHLDGVSPLGVLARGYSITRRDGERTPLRDAAEVAAGDRIHTRLATGEVVSEVTEVRGADAAEGATS